MKIAFTCNKLGNGGAERVISNISNQMTKDGHTVRIICLEKFEDFYYPLEEKIEIVELDKKISFRKRWINRKLAGIRNFIRLNNAIKGEDIIISFYTRQNCYSIIASKLNRIPIICAERDHFFMEDGFVNKILRRIFYPLADGFIHQTNMMRSYLHDVCKVQCDDVVLPNPLWIDTYIDRKPQTGYVSAVGRLAEQKNYSGMINAFALVNKMNSCAKLHIWGEGCDKEKLQKQIDDLNLHDIVILEGLTKNIPEILARSEVFVMFSHGEGYPNALMEALACGTPSISADCPVGGPRDMIVDGENGFLVPCNDEKLLAERILLLLDNVQLREKFSEKSIKIREDNNFQQIYGKWMEYINVIKMNGK